ncbi:MAG: PEGA domain-containing protein, partial [Myxococcota bacterium]
VEAARPKLPPPLPPARTPRPAPSAEPTQRGMPVWVLMMMLMMLVSAFGLVSLAGILLVIGGNSSPPPPPAPVVQAPVAPAAPPPGPAPRVSSANVLNMSFDSNPTGARVFEGDREICAATPCTIAQKDYAPGVRTFTVRLDGYVDGVVEVTDFTRPTVVDLVPLNRRTGRTGGGRSDDTILDAR